MKSTTIRLAAAMAATAGLFLAAQTLPLADAQATGPALTTAPSHETGPLRIHVTAVQGGAQWRADSTSKWQSLATGLDLTEGVEFRTGPKGSIQFTVGTDQVFRVDRLTAVKVLRASLLPDGTIKTDVGMTYGRVSKDVDAASRPHSDTIVTPSSTLAVRGTRVSLYDQPPFAPEAVSLTGSAVYTNVHGLLVSLGAKGAGTAKVGGDTASAAQYQLQNVPVDPQGGFSGRSPGEQALLASLAGLSGTDLGVFQSIEAQIAGGNFIKGFNGVGATEIPGALQFPMFWATAPSVNSVVNYSIEDPNGMIFTQANLPHATGRTSGTLTSSYTGSPIAGTETPPVVGDGFQEIDFGKPVFKGNYIITVTLSEMTLAQTPSAQVTAVVDAQQINIRNSPVGFKGGSVTLNSANPTASFTAQVPIAKGNGVLPRTH